ncbi:hypothetical protein F0U44_01585 [Nocardioides humilatus]|uniref:GerMN domain-containing protein n=1 Tax=Nocardioides humilatus TaxID=2607660 RepID=A0A5B1LN61_9ACTN|nr:LpqB family beta-propeller domain-containing protein [Nocardioides humilatus]KAA1421047.1 hypothetical protein F0U44_01585 [Nocardioides humilatus]
MSRRRPMLLRLGLGLVAAALLAGCVGLPDDGPVVNADVAGERDADRASSIDARPPQPGDSRLEIVNGFLEAMMAWPISTSVAKEYLTDDAAEEWAPESTIIYNDLAAPREDGGTVRIRLRDAALLDESGGWESTLPPDRSELEFQLTIEDGEFRIIDPTDALVVRSSWFQQRYRQASLYFFDPTAQVLVPEPVFVPVGRTFATSLVSALLAGPPRRLRDIVTTYVPPRLTVGLSVPVLDGVASLDLGGDAPQIRSDQASRMLAQLAATLRQEPSITALRLSIGGEEVELPGHAALYDVGSADAFDPSDTASTGVLYGLRRGRLVVGDLGDLRPVDGPFGWESRDLATVAVAPKGDLVAGVTTDLQQVVIGPLRAVRGDPGAEVTTLAIGEEFTRPTWDASGRLWLLERGPDGARVMVVHGTKVREIEVEGVTGQDARRILVSRDGTRLVALVTGPHGDRMVAARIALAINGRVGQVVESTVIWSLHGQRAIDIAWTGVAEVAVLTPARPGELFGVETVSADGATVGVDTLATMVTGRVTGLASEPYADTPVYAVARDWLIDIRTGERLATMAPVRELDYAG